MDIVPYIHRVATSTYVSLNNLQVGILQRKIIIEYGRNYQKAFVLLPGLDIKYFH